MFLAADAKANAEIVSHLFAHLPKYIHGKPCTVFERTAVQIISFIRSRRKELMHQVAMGHG
jgi:hypothetical protein